VATSAELKELIVEKIKAERNDPTAGDWKAPWEGIGPSDEVFEKLTTPKNWKRIFKGKQTIGDTTFVMRQFSYDLGEGEGIIAAIVTCDEDDNFLEGGIEFECS